MVTNGPQQASFWPILALIATVFRAESDCGLRNIDLWPFRAFVCFVVILGYAWASSQQAGSESHVNMEFSQQVGSESHVNMEASAHSCYTLQF